MAAGMSLVAAADGVAPPPRREAIPAPAPAATPATRRTSPAATVASVGGGGEPDGGVGGRAGLAPGGGDRDVSVEERAAGVAFAPGAPEAEEDPVGVPGCGGQARVAGELGGEAVEGLTAVVVL